MVCTTISLLSVSIASWSGCGCKVSMGMNATGASAGVGAGAGAITTGMGEQPMTAPMDKVDRYLAKVFMACSWLKYGVPTMRAIADIPDGCAIC